MRSRTTNGQRKTLENEKNKNFPNKTLLSQQRFLNEKKVAPMHT